MKRLPGLKEELQAPRVVRSDRIKLSNAVMYWQGSGSKIISKSCDCVVGDEVSQWDPSHPQNVRDLEKRTRSYKSAMICLVCTPQSENDAIWQSFLKSSQGYFTLRCKGCGKLTMRSCDLVNLQFESDYHEELRTYVVRKGTERLVCPVCHHEHVESDKAWMIQNGEYVHKIPELVKERPGFQAGALASQLDALSWSEIANAQLEAGKTADISIQQNFDNSWRGLPFRPRKISKDEMERFKEKHSWSNPPSLENVEWIGISVDTMDDYLSVGVYAFDVNDSIYLLESHEVEYYELPDDKRKAINEERKAAGKPPIITVEDLLLKQYLVKDGVGISPMLAICDQGGHRGDEVKHFARFHKNVIQWKGTTMTVATWKLSENQERLLLGNEKHWKAMLIHTMYNQRNRNENFFFVNPDISDEVIAQLLDVKPNDGAKWRRPAEQLGI